MRVRGLSPTNDWLFGKGRNDYLVDRRAVAQNIKTRLRSFLGDCFFDLSAGIDWFNLLGSKRQLELRLAISATILNTEGVQTLVELNFSTSVQNRIFLIQYEVDTIYGRIQGNIDA
jgi:hypothetical protein